MTKLRQLDFFTKYNMEYNMEFNDNDVIITDVKDWDKLADIQRFILTSENCYFISMDYDKMVIRVDE